jgi:hypothetical protein
VENAKPHADSHVLFTTPTSQAIIVGIIVNLVLLKLALGRPSLSCKPCKGILSTTCIIYLFIYSWRSYKILTKINDSFEEPGNFTQHGLGKLLTFIQITAADQYSASSDDHQVWHEIIVPCMSYDFTTTNKFTTVHGQL